MKNTGRSTRVSEFHQYDIYTGYVNSTHMLSISHAKTYTHIHTSTYTHTHTRATLGNRNILFVINRRSKEEQTKYTSDGIKLKRTNNSKMGKRA